jgi:hypothetical protein
VAEHCPRFIKRPDMRLAAFRTVTLHGCGTLDPNQILSEADPSSPNGGPRKKLRNLERMPPLTASIV